ncbi:MAG: hypothetical protein U1E94_04315 [Agitococcus sp.]
MSTDKPSLFADSWDDLEKTLKQKTRLALSRFEQTRQKIDQTVAQVRAISQDTAKEAASMAIREAKVAFNTAKTEVMRINVENSISDLRQQAELRLQQFSESLEQRREQEIAKNVEALRRRLMQRDEDRIAAKRVKEAGKVEARVEKLLHRLETIEQKTEDTAAASAALQLGLQVSKQVGVGKLARRAARQADELSSEVNKTLREVLPRQKSTKQWDTKFPEDEE